MTPFRSQNVPPPMSAYQISLPSVPVHVALSPSQDSLAVLFADGAYTIFKLNTRIPRAGSRGGGAISKIETQLQGRFTLENAEWRQVVLTAQGDVVALASRSDGQDVLVTGSNDSVDLPTSAGRVVCGVNGEAIVVLQDGKVFGADGELGAMSINKSNRVFSDWLFIIQA
jgi:hypothetical protein